MAITKDKNYRTGALDKRAQFQNMGAGTSDGMGGTEPGDWQDAIELWCDLDPLSGNERLQLMKLDATVSHKVTLRYVNYDISHESRMKIGERIFNLKFVINKGEQDAYMEIAATEDI